MKSNLEFIARKMIEDEKVIFFDFFRHAYFGFVRTDENRGHFVRYVEPKEFHCGCIKFNQNGICAHAFCLKELAERNGFKLHEEFDSHPISQAFQSWRTSIKDFKKGNLNFTYNAYGLPIISRLLNFWGLENGSQAVRKRDLVELAQAQKVTRSFAEQEFLRKGLVSPVLAFEESELYVWAKLIFLLDLEQKLQVETDDQGELIQVNFLADSQNLLSFAIDKPKFMKEVKKAVDFWNLQETQELHIFPLAPHCIFDSSGNLIWEPAVLCHDGKLLAIKDCREQVPHFMHPDYGYFQIQMGLSEFELVHGNQSFVVPHEEVVPFLQRFGENLKLLPQIGLPPNLLNSEVGTKVQEVSIQVSQKEGQILIESWSAKLNGFEITGLDLMQKIDSSKQYFYFAGTHWDVKSIEIQLLGESLQEKVVPAITMFRLAKLFKGRLKIIGEKAAVKWVKSLQNTKFDLVESNMNLRPYQQTGFEWMVALSSHGLGGLLCDQMGLGKTHQAMAHMAHIFEQKSDCLFLILCPRSVMHHWLEKLNQFLPAMPAYIQHNQDRPLKNVSSGAIISTYGTLRHNPEQFTETKFTVVYLDEIQTAKNHQTKVHQAIQGLQTQTMFGLTGTPIENQVQELRNLVDLVMPNYLGTPNGFESRFAKPIIEGCTKARNALKKLVKPIIMRRSKAEVLADLPPKTENIYRFALSPEEKTKYLEIKKQNQKDWGAVENAYVHAFQLISLLKRYCCHPKMVGEDLPSSKWEVCLELLNNALNEKEKVVIFTQYLDMIARFESYLDEQGIGFATITGSTTDRQGAQNAFQNNPDCRVFLGTVLAAGSGIDLTAGSVLIHYDRWWNPAKEDQATDRIHRIGQHKPVHVYKLVTLETIEQRIDQIIELKKKILEELVEFDPAHMSKALTMEELIEILRDDDTQNSAINKD